MKEKHWKMPARFLWLQMEFTFNTLSKWQYAEGFNL
jgi:hypothetical protein